MAKRAFLLCLCLALLAGAAPGRAQRGSAREDLETMPILDLYSVAYGRGAVAFSCTPAVYPGGRERPGYESVRRKLRARRLRARARLVAAFGGAPLEEIERAHAEEEHSLYRTGCDPRAGVQGRASYRRLLAILERRTRALAVAEEDHRQ
jgi:hypothetical protein